MKNITNNSLENYSSQEINFLSRVGIINLQDELLKATLSRNESLMLILIHAGADINAIYRFGNTYLIQEAISIESTNILRILLENGVNVNSVNSSGQTALHLAIMLGEVDHIKLLLKYGADPRINDIDEFNALDDCFDQDIITIVEEALSTFEKELLHELSDSKFLKETIKKTLKTCKEVHDLNLLEKHQENTGNCFFDSLSKQLAEFNIHHSHESLRAIGINHILENLSDYQSFISTNSNSTSTSTDSYIDNMSKPSTWAEHLIIRATALALNRTIMIHRADGTITPIAEEFLNEAEVIHLYYTGDHYMPHQVNTEIPTPTISYDPIEDQPFIDATDSHDLNIPLLLLMGLFSCCLSNKVEPS